MGTVWKKFGSVVLLGILFAYQPTWAGDENACAALLYDDQALLDALPPRLRPIVESSHFRSLVTKRDAAWAPFHKALDFALEHEESFIRAQIGEVDSYVRFDRAKNGDIVFHVKAIRSKGGFQFLDFVGATLEWVAKARASGKITEGFKVIGSGVDTVRLAAFLQTLGFKKGGPGLNCYVAGMVGGLAGYLGGRQFFAMAMPNEEISDAEIERDRFIRDISWGSVIGAGAGVGLFCFKKTGRNYSLEIKADGLPKKTDPVPPVGVPKIWPPAPLLKALPPPAAVPATN